MATFKEMKNGFLGQDQGVNFQKPYAQAKAIIIPFGLENTVSYGGGTKKGPRAIISASHQVEALDEESLKSPYKCGITTLQEPVIPKNNKDAVNLLAEIVEKIIKDNKYPLILGGEHSLTQGSIAGLSKKYKNFSVLHFDAHSDTRLEYHGNEYSHAAVMSQVLRKYPVSKLVQVGIRSLSDQNKELNFRKQNKNKIKTFWGWENPEPKEVVNAILTKNVFISFDVDVFDPSIMPSTGTPEPGGLLWWPTLKILKKVFQTKNVIGVDIVELAPNSQFFHPDFLVAKLVYKMIGYKFG